MSECLFCRFLLHSWDPRIRSARERYLGALKILEGKSLMAMQSL